VKTRETLERRTFDTLRGEEAVAHLLQIPTFRPSWQLPLETTAGNT